MPEAPLIIRDGHAVPPRDVEQVLLGHPAVAEVAVVGVPDRFPGEIVAAAVRLSAPLPSAAADLTRHCKVRLAPYKVPVRWLFVPALPRTTTGEPCRATLAARLAVASGFLGRAGRPRRGPTCGARPRRGRRGWTPETGSCRARPRKTSESRGSCRGPGRLTT